MGILGSVGSGRTTLAKLVSGISRPTEGSVQINGSVIPVFELRTGFDLNFDGYENMHIKGCMTGWSKQQIKEKQQEIIEFAELQDSIHLKMSGIKPVDRSRLGLAMILMDDAEIMVFDCPMQVGSIAMRNKCIAKMRERAEDSQRTLVMVNVIWEITGQLCERGIVLHNGEIKFDGPFDEAVSVYREKYRDRLNIVRKPETDDEEHTFGDDDATEFSDF